MVSEETTPEQTDALWSRVRLIEGQPLAERAAAYAALHEELSHRLESVPNADAAGGE